MIESIDAVIYTAYFLLPGYIIGEIIRQFVPDTEYNEFERILRYLGYSLLELSLWYWLFKIIGQKYNKSEYAYWLVLIQTILGTGFITGIILGLLRKMQLFRKVLGKLAIQIENPYPTGWDYKFANTDKEKWVCVCLDDSKYIRGKFGKESLASSVKDNHDIYIEEVYMMNDEGEWKKEERTDGIWISASRIKWINFYKCEEERKNANQLQNGISAR